MKPTRRFHLTSDYALDYPTIRTGRVINRLRGVSPVDTQLFTFLLESGLMEGAPKAHGVHIFYLASDKEDIAEAPVTDGKIINVAVKFPAINALDATNDEVRWRMYGAGLLGLLKIAEHINACSDTRNKIKSARESIPTDNFPCFPEPTEQDIQLEYEYYSFSRARKSGGKRLPPKVIRINRDDHYARHVGKTKGDDQFFLTFPFAPELNGVPGGNYIALYVFDRAGALKETKIFKSLPTASAEDTFVQELLDGLEGHKLCDIKIAPFAVQEFGRTFGLVFNAGDEEDGSQGADAQVTAEPGNYMAFHPPWNGEYDT